MTTQQMFMYVCTAVLFITVVLGGVFSSNAASIWLKNKREERAARYALAELRHDDRMDKERSDWMRLVQEKDGYIKSLQNELLRISKNHEIAMNLLKESERQRMGKDDASADE